MRTCGVPIKEVESQPIGKGLTGISVVAAIKVRTVFSAKLMSADKAKAVEGTGSPSKTKMAVASADSPETRQPAAEGSRARVKAVGADESRASGKPLPRAAQ